MARSHEAIEILQQLAQADVVIADEAGQPTCSLEDAISSTELRIIFSLDSSDGGGAPFWETLLDAHISVSNIGRYVCAIFEKAY